MFFFIKDNINIINIYNFYLYVIMRFLGVYTMPQLVPFFFSHQLIVVFLALIFLLFTFSKYILPNMLSIYLGRHTLANKKNS